MKLSPRTGSTLFALAYAVGAVALAVEVTGGAWDIQWHIAGLVEIFWTPPHTVLYGGAAVLAVAAFGGLLLPFLGARIPRALAVGLQVVLVGVIVQFVAGGFDQWWHANFGVDDAPSPPHVLLISGMVLAGFGLILGSTRLLRAENFLAGLAPGTRRTVSATLPLAFMGLYFALWGMTWILTYPGFAANPFLAAMWQRGVVVFAFAALLPFVVIGAARTIPWPGGATAFLVAATFSFYLVATLMGQLAATGFPDPALFLAGIGIFLLPGVATDLALRRRWGSTSLLIVVALLGALGGLVTLFQGGAVGAMTGGLEDNPLWFLALYALGGVVGGLLGLAFANALAWEEREGVPAPAVAG